MQKKYVFSLLFLIGILGHVFSQNPHEDGQWGNPIPFNVIPVAMANLPDGRVLVWSSKFHDNWGGGDGFTFTQIFDPSLGIDGGVLPSTATQTNHDMFCPGINNLADGRILATGGSSSERSSIYDPVTETWSRAADMNIPRGYHGAVTLSDGSAFTLGGSWNGGIGNKDAEIWTADAGWRLLPGIKNEILWNENDYSLEPQNVFRIDNHQWFWAAPNGKVFHAGPGEMMHWIDVSGSGSVTTIGKRGSDIYSMNGNTVMFDIGKILKVGGSYTYDSGTPSNEKSYVIDFNNEMNVSVTPTSNSMQNYRTFSSSVVLPNGEVVIFGGMETSLLFSDEGAYLSAEIYNPDTNTFKTVASMQVPRTYHSTGILLNDGRVLMGGGGLCGHCGDVNHMDGEVYSPPYLYDQNGSLAQRPTLSAPDVAFYEQQLTVTASTDVTDFSLVRLSSSTHSINNEQRRIPVSFTNENEVYTLNIPDANVLPPGYYMLFALNANGVPSISESVLIGPDLSCSVAGSACDDNNPLTVNDVSDGNCNCEGTPVVCEDISVVYKVNGQMANLGTEISLNQGNNLELGVNLEGVQFSILDPDGNQLANNTISTISTEQAGVYLLSASVGETPDTNEEIFCEKEILVNVSSETIEVTSVVINEEFANLFVGEKLELTESILPFNATDRTVVWTSSDVTVATVDEIGEVTAVAAGNAIISVVTNDGSFTASTEIDVANAIVAISDINLDIVDAGIFVDDVLNITATVLPNDATNPNLVWSSAHPSIAMVNDEGVVTGLSKGEAIISATSEDGLTTGLATINVTSASDVLMQLSPNPTAFVFYLFFNSSSHLDIYTFNFYDENNELVKVIDDPASTLVDGGNYRLVVSDLPVGVYTVEGVTSQGNYQEELIVERNIPVEGISLNIDENTLAIEEELALVATILPVDATDKSVVWSTSDESVATVDINGLVTAVSEGEAIITATTVDGDFTATSTITVNAPVIAVDGITLDNTEATLEVEETVSLIATVTPIDATDKNVVWGTSDENIATVDATGLVTAVSEGEALITATTVDGSFTATSTITVNAPVILVDGITLDVTEATLEVEETVSLIATVTPIDATDKNVVWSTSDETIATVDINGFVTAVSEGEALITATTVDGDFTATSTITVNAPVVAVDGITLDVTEATLEVEETVSLLATVIPIDATDKSVVWSTSDESIVTVDATGLVTAVSEGEAIITATTVDGGFVTSTTITVTEEPVSDVVMLVGPNPADYVVYVFFGSSDPLEITTLNIYDAANIVVKTFEDPASILVDGENYRMVINDLPVGDYTIEGVVTTGVFTEELTIEREVVAVTGIGLNVPNSSVQIANELVLSALVSPSNATDKNVIWSTSNEAIASVAPSGTVTGISVGEVLITATTVDGGFVASTTLTVTEEPVSDVVMLVGPNPADFVVYVFFGSSDPLEITTLNIYDTANILVKTFEDPASILVDGENYRLVINDLPVGNYTIEGVATTGVFTEELTIAREVVPVSGVSLNVPNSSVQIANELVLSALVSPSNATDKNVIWSTSNEAIASVAPSGTVTGISVGEVLITATTVDGGFVASTTLTVTEEPVSDVVMLVGPNPADYVVYVFFGSSDPLEITTLNIYDTANILVKTFEDPASILVDGENYRLVINDLPVGNYTIEGVATTEVFTEELTIEREVVPVSGVSLNVPNSSVQIANELVLSALVSPSNATDKNVIWSTSNVAIASVAPSGTVKGISVGEVIITATTVDGGFVASTTITVTEEPVSDVLMLVGPNPADFVVYVFFGSSDPLEITTLNIYDTANILVKTFEDPASILVDGENYRLVINDLPVGNYTIEGVATTGVFTKELIIEREVVAVTGISFDQEETAVQIQNELDVTAIVTPNNATNTAVVWSTSDETIATVDAFGKVTGVSEGNAVITATTVDGGFIATLSITVTAEPVPEVTMLIAPNPATYVIYVYFSSPDPVEILTIHIYDSLGRLVKTLENPASVLDGENYRLVVQELPAGSYFIEGVTSQGNIQKQAVIEQQ